MRITNPPAGHDSLDGVSTSDHHTKYSDADAVSAVVEDAVYGSGWNADTTHAPSQNAVYDAIEALPAGASDTAYASSWNGVTSIAPSKNAVYDKIETLGTRPVFDRVVRTAGNLTTTSSSLVDVTGATITFTTGVFPILYGAAQTVKMGGYGPSVFWNVDIDGTLQLGTQGLWAQGDSFQAVMSGSFSSQTAALSAGSHTIKEQFQGNYGGGYTATIYANSNSAHIFWAHEIR